MFRRRTWLPSRVPPYLDSGWGGNRNGRRADLSGDPSAPFGDGSHPDAPSSQRQGFRAKMNARRATAHLLKNVGRENRIWVSWPLLPTSILPMLENSPSWVSRDTIFSGHWGGRGVPNGRAKGNLRYLSEDHGWRRGGNMDPLTRAPQVAGAVPAEPYTSRILGVLPGRTVQTTGRHVWRPGGRLG